MLLHPLTANTGYALIIGKTTGIFIFCWIAVRLKLAVMPENVKWIHIFGAALLGGMGFTMSIFIAQLTFNIPEFLNASKAGIIAATIISGILGFLILRITLKKQGRPVVVEKEKN